MRTIARRPLIEFDSRRARQRDHTARRSALQAWFQEVRTAEWRSLADVKRSYATASIIDAERVVFYIKGNS